MLAIIIILTVYMLICPLFDLIFSNPTDPDGRRLRFCKMLIIILALLWLVFILFIPANSVVLFPHAHGAVT